LANSVLIVIIVKAIPPNVIE